MAWHWNGIVSTRDGLAVHGELLWIRFLAFGVLWASSCVTEACVERSTGNRRSHEIGIAWIAWIAWNRLVIAASPGYDLTAPVGVGSPDGTTELHFYTVLYRLPYYLGNTLWHCFRRTIPTC